MQKSTATKKKITSESGRQGTGEKPELKETENMVYVIQDAIFCTGRRNKSLLRRGFFSTDEVRKDSGGIIRTEIGHVAHISVKVSKSVYATKRNLRKRFFNYVRRREFS